MPQPKPLPPVELLREIFDYKPDTGELVFRVYNNRHKKGDILSRRTKQGYLCWTFDYKQYYAHRIAWKIQTGQEPPEVIDHKNRQPDDNRWCNLRASDNVFNRYNMTPWGKRFLPGVFRGRSGVKYYAKITVNKEQIYLGTFETEEKAHAAYCDAHRQHFGNHSIYAT